MATPALEKPVTTVVTKMQRARLRSDPKILLDTKMSAVNIANGFPIHKICVCNHVCCIVNIVTSHSGV